MSTPTTITNDPHYAAFCRAVAAVALRVAQQKPGTTGKEAAGAPPPTATDTTSEGGRADASCATSPRF